jgi:hypothetical protein
MKTFQPILVLLIVLLSTTTTKVYALSANGSGSISYEGTGTIVHMQSPYTVFDKYGMSCTPGISGDIMTVCNPALNTSLIGSRITRAEDLRVMLGPTGPLFTLSFACAGCSSGLTISWSQGLNGTRLTDDNVATLQSMIDQAGAQSVRMSLSITGGGIFIDSARELVQVDIKPGSAANKFAPQSRGLFPVSILTTPIFNAASVDTTSVRFGTTGREASPVRAVLDDVDGDGDLDLVLLFRSQETGIGCSTRFTYLRGQTITGDLIAGTDAVSSAGCN